MHINFQQIYEDEIQEVTKDSLNLSRHFTELSNEHQRLFEDLVTAALSSEMSIQLDSFSGLVQAFLSAKKLESED